MPDIVSRIQLEGLVDSTSSPDAFTIVEGLDPAIFFQLLRVTQQTPTTASIIRRHCVQGEIVFREGVKGDTMYMVLAGRCALVKGDLNSPTILGLCNVGSIFGEMALLENEPYSSTVVALDDLALLGINRKRFHQFVEEMPSLSIKIMEVLSLRLRDTDEARASTFVAEQRLEDQVLSLETEKQRLEELERLRKETTDLIIHDLRNPLNAINLSLNTLSLVLPENFPQANRQLLEVAKMSVDHMKQLVDSLLGVSRIESGEEEFVFTNTDVGSLIQEVAGRFTLLGMKKISLWQQIEPALPPVRLDAEKISRVLVNLLDNAFRYTPENGRITIEARRLGMQVQLSVSDAGPGIPIDQRERIFTRFAQINYDNPSRRGFGLGLTYCRLAVEAHGGRIWVEDGPDSRGSCFIFTLPLESGISSIYGIPPQ
ncbi:MAG: hypothetical protein A2Z16_09230 [Chloroflexi bacterium RBG_16_54_18]|nr:MAG: hypothetical protein A2Z16_09230 [Chloroflexi bacterium RBG_16_54_18]